MSSLDAYLPIDRALALAGGQPLADRATGAALFADISGFTSLAESLVHRYGTERGAEALTANLNSTYDALMASVGLYGGSVIGLSGDAMTCWYPEDNGLRALASALAMQDTMPKLADRLFAGQESKPLTMKVAITQGPVRRFQIGDPSISYLDVIAGATLDRLAATEQHAYKGEVAADDETAARLGDQLRISEWRTEGSERYAIVSGLNVQVPHRPWPTLAVDALGDDQVRPWLLPLVYERLKSGQGEFLAELRPVVSMFIRFGGIKYDTDDRAGEKLDAYVRWVQSILARYEGILIELTIGDKGSYLDTSIGAPIAHDDDALRAVSAAREIRTPPPHLQFISHVQIGISRGRLRVGPYGGSYRRTYGMQGDEVNVAARLMQQAAPGQIIVSKNVAQATAHRFQFRALGAVKVKGKAEPVDIFGLLGARNEPGPVGGVSTPERRRAPMVGRSAESAVLRKHLERLLHEGRGSTVLIEGEAGIGKSRLVQDLVEQAHTAGATCVVAAGEAVEQSTVYFPWRAVFSQLFELDTLPDDPDSRRAQVVGWLESDLEEPDLARLAPLLNVVLALNLPDNETTSQLTGHVRAEVTRDLLARILKRTLRASPLVIVIEDAHWLDSASWALIQRVAALSAPLLLVIPTRPLGVSPPPEYRALGTAPGTEYLKLEHLSPDQVATLVQTRLGALAIPQPVLALILDKAEGNPFFSEELAFALRDSGVIVKQDGRYEMAPGAPDLRTLGFPDTVEGVVTSRIDRLTPSQQLTVKVASVIGRIFAHRVLSEIYPVPEPNTKISQDLDTLARLDLTPLESPEPDLRYIFKHVITQEVAYSLMLYAQRQQLHRAVAEWYERTFADALAPHYPLLAHHWAKAVETPPSDPASVVKAIDYLRKAGKQAAQSNANQEAMGLYNHALQLVDRLPPGAQRLQLELALLLESGPPIIANRGYGDEAVQRNFARARAICEQLGPVPQLLPVLNGLGFYYIVRTDFPTFRELSHRLVAIARTQQDPTMLAVAANSYSAESFFTGDLTRTPEALDMLSPAFTLEQHRAMATTFGHDPVMATLVINGMAMSVNGFPDQGLERAQQGVQLAREIGHHFSEGYALLFTSGVYCALHDLPRTLETAQEVLVLSRNFGFPVWQANGAIYHGWARAMQGEPEAGIAEIRAGLAAYERIQIGLSVPYFMGLLAEVYLGLRDSATGLRLIADALELGSKTGELWSHPELYRLQGELLLVQSPPDEQAALAAFREAIAAARRYKTRLWELRATSSLTRLLERQGDRNQARKELSAIYSQFTEGFQTTDLKEARTLLDTLG